MSTERPRGLVRTREDELLVVGLVEVVTKQPCVCLSLGEHEKPCIVCKAATFKARIGVSP